MHISCIYAIIIPIVIKYTVIDLHSNSTIIIKTTSRNLRGNLEHIIHRCAGRTDNIDGLVEFDIVVYPVTPAEILLD